HASGARTADARSAGGRAEEAGPARGAQAVPVLEALSTTETNDITHRWTSRWGPGWAARWVKAVEANPSNANEGKHGGNPAQGPARSGCPFRTPDQPLEPEDAAVHLRGAQRDLHH